MSKMNDDEQAKHEMLAMMIHSVIGEGKGYLLCYETPEGGTGIMSNVNDNSILINGLRETADKMENDNDFFPIQH